jgi:hypothetical protein
MDSFDCYEWKGLCNIKSPDRTFIIIQNWTRFDVEGVNQLDRIFFGRELVRIDRSILIVTKAAASNRLSSIQSTTSSNESTWAPPPQTTISHS